MRAANVGLLFSASLLLIATVHAQLDAPGEKIITVGSEIERGAKEIAVAKLAPELRGSLDDFAELFQQIVDGNTAKNTDSPGFLLGARFAQWVKLDQLLQSDRVIRYSTHDQLRRTTEKIQKYFEELRTIQRELSVTDDQLLQAIGLKESDAAATGTRSRMSIYAPPAQRPARPASASTTSSSSARASSPSPAAEPQFTNLTEGVSINDGVILYPGTRVEIVARAGDRLTIAYEGERYSVAVSQTTVR